MIEHNPNAAILEQELCWLRGIIDERLRAHIAGASPVFDAALLHPPDPGASDSAYARLVRQHELSALERLAIILALAPHLRPHLLDTFLIRNTTLDRRFSEFGGVLSGGRGDGDFLPTGETLAFLIGGEDLAVRFHVARLLAPQHRLTRQRVLLLAREEPFEHLSPMKTPLRPSEDLLSLIALGEPHQPALSAGFPARRIETQLTWDDIVLSSSTRKQIEEIMGWVEHGQTLMQTWGMAAKLRPGYRSLFYGPPGTGKTMTACLLGKTTGHPVYKVDISLVVSKYIGETEKNLGQVFDQAESKGWILFFDEADALFGRRSETRDAHDRYANQEVAFLLQRIEVFDGITILCSNLPNNIDDAFARRFESIIHFPMPRPEERLRLWRQGFSAKAQLDHTVNLEQLARDYALSGGSLMNVIRYVSLQSLRSGGRPISNQDLIHGINRELAKELKMS